MLPNFRHFSSFSLILLLVVSSIKSSCYKRSTCVCTLQYSNNCPCATGRPLGRACWGELNEASQQIIYVEEFFYSGKVAVKDPSWTLRSTKC